MLMEISLMMYMLTCKWALAPKVVDTWVGGKQEASMYELKYSKHQPFGDIIILAYEYSLLYLFDIAW